VYIYGAEAGRAAVVVPMHVKDAHGAHVRRCAQATKSARRNARPDPRIVLVFTVRNRDVSLSRDGPRAVCHRRFADEEPHPFRGEGMWPVKVAVKFCDQRRANRDGCHLSATMCAPSMSSKGSDDGTPCQDQTCHTRPAITRSVQFAGLSTICSRSAIRCDR